MMFHVVAVGRLRNADLRSACDEYATRIRRYNKLEIDELPAAPGSARTKRLALEAERDKIVPVLKTIPACVLLTRAGRRLSSQGFSRLLAATQEAARDLAFVIGGAYGVHAEVAALCADAIQLSHMTLPHEMARLILLEQIYRGFTILRREPYHKGD